MTVRRQAGRCLAAMIAAALPLMASPAEGQAPVDPGVGSDAVQARLYSECMDLARRDAAAADKMAANWLKNGGGDGARHCAAVAALTGGRYAEAGRQFEALARESNSGKQGLKAELDAQASQAWLIAGETEKALASINRAIERGGDDSERLIDRAIIYGSREKFWEALDDLSAVLDRQPRRADVLVLRATAWRRLGNLDLADDDIDRAVAIAPANVEALLEQGVIRQRRGAFDAAQASWRKVIEIAPESPAADTARRRIKRLGN
jgi:tetratricopeptide (TPR) repeat protein